MTFHRTLLVCLGLLASLWLGTAHALPTVDQVQAAAQRGDYAEAEKLMREVVAAKPDSARAHYVLAEILAHGRQFDEAAEHTRRARSLDPAIKFTDPTKFTAFEQLLQREQAAAARPVVPPNASPVAPPQRQPAHAQAAADEGLGVPVWLLAIVAVAFIAVVASWMRRRTAVQPQPALAGAGGSYGMGGYGAGMPAPGATTGGPGMLGVGLAAAGGVAAGMLAERMLHGGHDERGTAPREPGDTGDTAGGAAGGLIPGSFDGGSADGLAQDLVRRDIDFGSGGSNWDAGGGADFGGGGSDDW